MHIVVIKKTLLTKKIKIKINIILNLNVDNVIYHTTNI